MDRFDVNIRDWEEEEKIQNKYLSEWESEIKKSGFLNICECGSAYTWEHIGHDPKCCPKCGGREGDLIFK